MNQFNLWENAPVEIAVENTNKDKTMVNVRDDVKEKFENATREELLGYLSTIADDMEHAEDTDAISATFEMLTGKRYGSN